jgi:NADH pyrophosphatase NudC (nudix superfamily)
MEFVIGILLILTFFALAYYCVRGYNLMIGFIADYVSGEIKLQDEELSSGSFFSKDNLPEIPHKLSLARKMIDWWLGN